jgi:hypothetical protein
MSDLGENPVERVLDREAHGELNFVIAIRVRFLFFVCEALPDLRHLDQG